ncbi:hypothetical protein JXA88_11035 [Candidatus Fermentibacteria bacterium]|nr:hypothetical protein [Candidatus Fermentibacteria bacterium]
MIISTLCLAMALSSIPVDEAPVGARGWGLTVFQGTRPDTFGVEVIGTLRGSVVGESRVLVRLTGELAESTGVAAGMSGSPVYVGDRLLGALASTFANVTEPVGMVTPIAAMLRPDSTWTVPPGGLPLPMTGSSLGFETDALRTLSTGLPADISFTGGSRGDAPAGLEPGHVAAAVLVDGDWSLSILGTVTWRSGDQVAAFGHQLFGFGPVELPLASGSVIATVANRALPFKMTNAGSVVGSVTYDGPNGVLGYVGRMAPTLPLTIAPPRPNAPALNLRLAIHPLLTPLLLRVCVQNCGGLWGGAGVTATSARMTVRFADGSSRDVERAASGSGAFSQLSEELARLIDGVLNCPLGRVAPESVSISFSAPPDHGVYYLESVAVNGGRGFADEERSVTVRFLRREGGPVVRTVHMALPPGTAERRLLLQAGDAASVAQWERERAALSYMPNSVEHYLDVLFSIRRPDRFYLRILTDDRGWSRRGGEVTRLPPSMTRILGRSPQRGLHDLTTVSVVSTAEITLDGPVYGSAIIDLAAPKEGLVP